MVSEETPKVEIVPEEIPEVEVREENFFVPTKAVAEVKEVSRGEDKNFEPVNLTDITKIFDENHISQGMLCLHALSENISDDEERKNWAEYLAKEVGFILDDPLVVKELHSFDTFSFWTNYMEIPESSIGNSFDYLRRSDQLSDSKILETVKRGQIKLRFEGLPRSKKFNQFVLQFYGKNPPLVLCLSKYF